MPSETGYWNAEEAAVNHDFSEGLAEWISNYLSPEKTVFDFGAGNGKYVDFLNQKGFTAFALEGDKETVTETSNIIEQDLTKPFKVDAINIICLEVGEHLPENLIDIFLDNLSSNTLGKLILSWAIPGQEGYYHTSCRSNIWVVFELEKRGFKLLAADSLAARDSTEYRFDYFKNTIMVFEKI